MVSVKRSSSLMKGWGRKAALGMTIDEDGIRIVRFNPKLGTVEGTDMLPLPSLFDEDGVQGISSHVEAVKQWVHKSGLAGSRVHLSAPTSQSFIRLIRVPKAKGKQLRQVTELEVESSIRFPFEDPIVDYYWFDDDGSEEGTIRAFVAAVPHSIVKEAVTVLELAGLQVASVDLATIALERILKQQNLLASDCLMAVNFKLKEAEVYLYHRGIPDFIRTFPLEPMSEDNLNTWRYGEIVSSVTRIMNFYEFTLHDGNERIKEIMITGNAPDKSMILNQMNEAFSEVAVSEIDLSSYFSDPDLSNRDSYAIALGLALRGGKGR
ncbi:type IV pilus biogenesis protein PilM [Fontibacillus sp. BL9]|uniref:type IV pilus biogenesis protein PilM n=1 Tax=Fontibacillus sp. BL9 TaxID=3389971 RepID=UPI00397A2675